MIRAKIPSFNSQKPVRLLLFRSWEMTASSRDAEQHWLKRERSHVPAIDSKYPSGNYSRLKRTTLQLSPPLLASTIAITPPPTSLPLSSHHKLPSAPATLPFVLLTPRQYTGDLWIFTPVEYAYHWQCIIFAPQEINILPHDTHIYGGSKSVQRERVSTRDARVPPQSLMIKDSLTRSNRNVYKAKHLSIRDKRYYF